jgi:hypothetical protein
VNALWDGRLVVDAARGLPPPPAWSHRFRRSLFVAHVPSRDHAERRDRIGPFGDVKNYNGRDSTCPWYPAGLAVEGRRVAPPPVPPLDGRARAALIETVLAELGARAPVRRGATPDARDGTGRRRLGLRGRSRAPRRSRSTLHRRIAPAIVRDGRYLSIDTGKYSMAPWIADRTGQRAARLGGPAGVDTRPLPQAYFTTRATCRTLQQVVIGGSFGAPMICSCASPPTSQRLPPLRQEVLDAAEAVDADAAAVGALANR